MTSPVFSDDVCEALAAALIEAAVEVERDAQQEPERVVRVLGAAR